MEVYRTDQQPEQQEKRGRKRYLEWLRNPQTLKILLKLALVIFNIAKWLVELWPD